MLFLCLAELFHILKPWLVIFGYFGLFWLFSLLEFDMPSFLLVSIIQCFHLSLEHFCCHMKKILAADRVSFFLGEKRKLN